MCAQNIEKPLFKDVVNDYYDDIFRFVYKQLNSIEDTKDITQDVFTKVHGSYANFNPRKSSIRTWIYKIANNHVINYWNSAYFRYRSKYEFDFTQVTESKDPLSILIQEEDSKNILLLMRNNLNSRNLRIMNLYFFSGLSPKEIAETMNMNQKTVSNIISLSINKIKRKLVNLNE